MGIIGGLKGVAKGMMGREGQLVPPEGIDTASFDEAVTVASEAED